MRRFQTRGDGEDRQPAQAGEQASPQNIGYRPHHSASYRAEEETGGEDGDGFKGDLDAVGDPDDTETRQDDLHGAEQGQGGQGTGVGAIHKSDLLIITREDRQM